jgi:hypothetical protein
MSSRCSSPVTRREERAAAAAEVGDAHAPGRTFCRARCLGYPPTRNAQATAPWRATFTTGSRLTRQWSPRSPGV